MGYNQHIFNLEKKELIRDFESAYQHFETVYPAQFLLDFPKFRLVFDKLKTLPTPKIIDIGCGYGAFVNYLNRANMHAIGVDVSATAINKGKKMFGANLDIRAADLVGGLPFEKQAFDYVICFGVLNWLVDSIDVCLTNLNDIIKKNGYLAISFSYKDTNVFFRNIISCEEDFLKIINRYFIIEDYIVHYHELGIKEGQSQNMNISQQHRDLTVFCRKKD